MQELERVREIVQKLNIIDDIFFQKMGEDIGFCEEVISTIMGQNVIVKNVTPQKSIKNLQGRSVILDVLCELENGKECNIELQKADNDNHVIRVRYNASCITANITEPGLKFEKVPEVICIYISTFDIFHAGKTVYHIDRVIRETGDVQDNGVQEIYVNTKIDDGTDIAELMRIFKDPNAYDFEKFPRVSARKKQFKKIEGGNENMCDLVENYARERAEEATKEAEKKNALKLFENGVGYEIVRASITSLSDEEMKELYRQVYPEG